MTQMEKMGALAKRCAAALRTKSELKKSALVAASDLIIARADDIMEENLKDIEAARQNGISATFIDRLSLNGQRIHAMAQGIREVSAQDDPVGRVLERSELKNGLKLERVTVPLGAVGIIFESRPNVTADAAALCIKAGNSVILRGGKEAYKSNRIIADIIDEAFQKSGLPSGCIQLVDDLGRESAKEMMELTDYLDVLIPRGGAGLIQAVKNNSRVPVIETGVGNCHIYIDESADVDMAVSIVFNAKTSRPSVCNAAETLLVHKNIAKTILPKIKAELDKKNVEIRGCRSTAEIIDGVKPACEQDWYEEFLTYILAVRVVGDIDEAIEHIEKYSSGHSEAIVTRDEANAAKFAENVDSSAIYVNASTRFTDGGEFGLGAEIGISTQKLHARGPMGLRELTSYKYIIHGDGQIR